MLSQGQFCICLCLKDTPEKPFSSLCASRVLLRYKALKKLLQGAWGASHLPRALHPLLRKQA